MDFVSSVGFGKAPKWGAVALGNVLHEAGHFFITHPKTQSSMHGPLNTWQKIHHSQLSK